MDSLGITLPWLSTQPAWRVRDHTLTARANLLSRCVKLFGWDRLLHIDSNRRALFFKTRRFWFVTHTVIIPFCRIKSILYGYSGNVWAEFSSGEFEPEAPEGLDRFHVGLLLNDDSPPVHLFTIHGHAALAADWLLDHYDVFEITGGEEDSSRDFVWWLRKFIGVPVRSLMHAKVHEALRAQLEPCPRCSRKIMRSAPKCVYCGTRFNPVA